MQKLSLNGKTAVVCGASSGLGNVLAKHLARHQLENLVVVARNGNKLAELQDELRQSAPSTQVIPVAVDVCNKEQLQAKVQSLRSQLDRVHLLIQAVGKSDRGTLLELPAEEASELWATNVHSNLNVLQCFSDLLSTTQASPEHSTFVAIGSLASLFAPRFLGGYAIAKHSVAAFAQQARLELAGQGTHVTLICPGPIRRDDAGTRYAAANDDGDLPAAALQPGGGAKVKGLAPDQLAADIIRAACNRKRRLIRPRSAALLLILSSISPRLGDFILRKKTS